MKKTVAIIISLMLTFGMVSCGNDNSSSSVSTQNSENITTSDFPDLRKVEFCMSKDEVKKVEDLKISEENDKSILYNDVNVNGKTAQLEYEFDDTYGLLNGVLYLFNDMHLDYNDYIDDYHELYYKLIQKYGEPSEDNTKESDSSYDKEKRGYLVAKGELTYKATWKKDDMLIGLALMGDNHLAHLALGYKSNII